MPAARPTFESDPQRRPHVFVSHSSADKEFARRLVLDLSSLGVDVWFDEWELEVGDSLERSIGRGLDTSKFVAIVLSPKSVRSKWCRRELASSFAREQATGAKVVLPLLLGEVASPKWLRDRLHLDFTPSRYHESLAYLAGAAHGIPKQSLALRLHQNPPTDICVVGDILLVLGWNGRFFVDPTQYAQNLEALESVSGRVGAVVLGPEYERTVTRLRKAGHPIEPIRWPLE